MERQLTRIAQKGLKLDMVQTYFSSISWVAFQIFAGVLSGVYCLHGVERVDSNRRYYAVSDLFFIYCCTDCKCDGIASDYFQRVGIS